ncbi:haloacid dehalogenase [Thermococcus bergensis]|jgi:translin|uniref:haloacid dehalogenase n=1 Tax=Thermococcus bergensis TaxID=2689387 RepID=UPI001CED1D79|nr:haloacid dehalogenase [Thermococcus bergensis]MCA6214494.1 haloacid dehalogenase [Thermococcus bergensis]
MNISEIIAEIREVLDKKDELREEALKLTRDIVRLSGDSIKALHRGEIKTAKERLEKAEELVKKLKEKLKGHEDLYFTGYVQSAHQEYVEALLFYCYLLGKDFPSPKEIGIPEADYALGIGDFIGELRRYFLTLLLKGDLEEAQEVYAFMEKVYDELVTLEYPKGLVNIRQKQDQARYVLERTLEDLTRAKVNKDLEKKLEEWRDGS